MNNKGSAVIHFDYGGFYSEDGEDVLWNRKEAQIYTLVIKRSLDEVTYDVLVDKICMKIGVIPDEIQAQCVLPPHYVPKKEDNKLRDFLQLGVMKKWGHRGGPASHGCSKAHRKGGSTGPRDAPGMPQPMNPEQNHRQCIACGESEPSFIHTVSKNGAFRRLCTDCLLKEHRELFCPVCLVPFVDDLPPPNARIICLDCSSITHLDCSPPPSSSSFTCPPCSDPNFSFFPKSHLPNHETTLDPKSGQALIAAAAESNPNKRKIDKRRS